MLKNKGIQDLAAAIADSNQAVPAGGTTIASSAFLSISLLELVIKVSEKELSTNERKKLKDLRTELKAYKEILIKAMDDDVSAYQKNSKNNFKNPSDLIEIIAIPLDIAEVCSSSLKIIEKIEKEVKVSVKADYKISCYNLKAALKGAISIIESNYSFFSENSDYLIKVKKRIKELKRQINNC